MNTSTRLWGFSGIFSLHDAPLLESVERRLCAAANYGVVQNQATISRSIGASQKGCAMFASGNSAQTNGFVAQRDDLRALCSGRLDDDDCAAHRVLDVYEKWRDECPSHLWGDYVFALCDARRKRFLCASSPLQAPHLYYVFDGETLRWAHDPRPLLDEPDVSRDFDLEYLTTYAVMSSLNWERTPYAAIKKLPAGYALKIENGQLKTWRWWHPPAAGSLRLKSRRDYEEMLGELMCEAVRVRLPSKGKVSLALSRGADSAGIAAALARLRNHRVLDCEIECVTFSTPEHPEADESEGARQIAQHLGLPHRIVEVGAENADFTARLGDLTEPSGVVVHDEVWNAMRLACEENGSHVLLTGMGGEVFESPFLYLGDLARDKKWVFLMRELWRWKRAGISWANGLKTTLRGLQEPPSHWQPAKKLEFYPWLRHPELCKNDYESLKIRHPVERDTYRVFAEKGDVSHAMQPLFSPCGVELCSPLRDRRLVEFACALPLAMRLRRQMPDGRLVNKPLLRAAFARELSPNFAKPSKPLRAQMGHSFQRFTRQVQAFLDEPPRGVEDAFDLRVLREHLPQLQQDTGSKRYVALTSLLVCWLAHNQQTNSYSRIAEPNAIHEEVTL